MNKSQSKIRAIQNSNLVLESRYFNSKVTLSEQTAGNKEYLGNGGQGDPFEYLKVVDASGVETYYFRCTKPTCKKSYPNWTKAVGDTAIPAIKEKVTFKQQPEATSQLGTKPVDKSGEQKVDNSGTLPSKEGEDVNVSKETPKGEEFVEPSFPEAKGD